MGCVGSIHRHLTHTLPPLHHLVHLRRIPLHLANVETSRIVLQAKHVVASLSSITTVYFTVVVDTPMLCVAKGLHIVVLVIIQYATYIMAIALRYDLSMQKHEI